MNASPQVSWSTGLGRQIVQLILLLVCLVIIGVGYDVWSHRSIEIGKRNIAEQHLASNSHYLHAMQELRNIQSHHALQAVAGVQPTPAAANQFRLQESQYRNKFYRVDQWIDKALGKEAKFSSPRFDSLTSRLRHQLSLLHASLTAYRNGEADDTALLADIEPMLTVLEQLVRLHRITHENGLEELRDKENVQDSIFYLLLSILLIAGLLVSRRSFGSINRIIGQQMAAEEKIKYQAHYDELTSLPNRFLSLDRLSTMIENAKLSDEQVAVIYIDLDFFKKVNDMVGHVSGDKLLVETAQRIENSVREVDTVGRLGGDEFIILVGGINRTTEVDAIAENLIQQMSRPFSIEGREIILGASIGISLYPAHGRERFELIRKADTAMYHSKQQGRNTYTYFTESMNQGIARKLSIEGQIHGALDRNEFEVYFQQKVDISSGRIIGAEALLRWKNLELGQIPPDEFIPVAEQTGLILPIGEFVLEQALGKTREWQQLLARDFKIAVNLSPRQFSDQQLVDKISRCLHRLGVSSRSLELEITEGVLMSEYVQIDEALSELTRMGISIAMDDFGTGYSSLNYLRNYPFDVIKIDRSFIRDIDSNSLSEQLNHAAVSMAHALNICVVAEGVETESQLEVLKRLQCDIAQGYLFGKPMPGEAMTALLSAQRIPLLNPRVVEISKPRDTSPKTY